MARMIMMSGMAECADQAVTINGNLRTTSEPCGMWCDYSDLAAWRSAARQRVYEVVARANLSKEGLAQAKNLAAEIESIQPSTMLDVGAVTHRLAQLYRYANCLTTVMPGEDVPVIPDTPTKPTNMLMIAAIAGIAYLALKR